MGLLCINNCAVDTPNLGGMQNSIAFHMFNFQAVDTPNLGGMQNFELLMCRIYLAVDTPNLGGMQNNHRHFTKQVKL